MCHGPTPYRGLPALLHTQAHVVWVAKGWEARSRLKVPRAVDVRLRVMSERRLPAKFWLGKTWNMHCCHLDNGAFSLSWLALPLELQA